MGFTCPECGDHFKDTVDFAIHRANTGHAKDLHP